MSCCVSAVDLVYAEDLVIVVSDDSIVAPLDVTANDDGTVTIFGTEWNTSDRTESPITFNVSADTRFALYIGEVPRFF